MADKYDKPFKPSGKNPEERRAFALEYIAANLAKISKAVESLIPEKIGNLPPSRSDLRRMMERIRAAPTIEAAMEIVPRDSF